MAPTISFTTHPAAAQNTRLNLHWGTKDVLGVVATPTPMNVNTTSESRFRTDQIDAMELAVDLWEDVANIK